MPYKEDILENNRRLLNEFFPDGSFSIIDPWQEVVEEYTFLGNGCPLKENEDRKRGLIKRIRNGKTYWVERR